jgi:hypothetical protein
MPRKLVLTKTYVHGGRFFGPGPVEFDDKDPAYDDIRAKEPQPESAAAAAAPSKEPAKEPEAAPAGAEASKEPLKPATTVKK